MSYYFKEGDYVRWNDPGINDYDPVEREELLDREFQIIDIYDDDTAFISDGFSEAEVYLSELEPITSKK